MFRILTTAVLLLLAAPALAQVADQPDTEGGRYILRRVDDGLMRVDRETGQTSFCNRRGEAWVCEAVADDRDAMQAEIERLTQENGDLAREIGRLKTRIARLEGGAEAPSEGDPGADDAPPESDGPTDEEIDRIMRSVETMMRRFMDMARELRDEYGQPDDSF